MDKEKIRTRQEDFRVWRDSEIGKLFEAYDSATGHAWVVDATSGSPARLNREWEKQRAAKVRFLDKLCALAGVENPYR